MSKQPYELIAMRTTFFVLLLAAGPALAQVSPPAFPTNATVTYSVQVNRCSDGSNVTSCISSVMSQSNLVAPIVFQASPPLPWDLPTSARSALGTFSTPIEFAGQSINGQIVLSLAANYDYTTLAWVTRSTTDLSLNRGPFLLDGLGRASDVMTAPFASHSPFSVSSVIFVSQGEFYRAVISVSSIKTNTV